MPRAETLADYLGVADHAIGEPAPRLEDIVDAKAFADAVLSSIEFRRYILNSLAFGSLPAAVTCRLMDYAWGKPPERVEHTGKDGAPIETITEVRRIIVRMPEREEERPSKVVH